MGVRCSARQTPLGEHSRNSRDYGRHRRWRESGIKSSSSGMINSSLQAQYEQSCDSVSQNGKSVVYPTLSAKKETRTQRPEGQSTPSVSARPSASPTPGFACVTWTLWHHVIQQVCCRRASTSPAPLDATAAGWPQPGSQTHGHTGHRCKGSSKAGGHQSLVRVTGEGIEGPGSHSAQLVFLTEVLCTAGQIPGELRENGFLPVPHLSLTNLGYLVNVTHESAKNEYYMLSFANVSFLRV